MNYENEKKQLRKGIVALGVVALIGAGSIGGLMYGWQQYKVFSAEQDGRATLAKAEQDRQIAVAEARAKKESAEMLAEAEIARAKGLAKANEIVADSLKGKDEYIHYLWIEALKESKDQVIYIPTEAGIPITESNRLKTDFNKELGGELNEKN